MTEVLKRKFNSQNREPLRVPLSMLSGELTAERFTRCDVFLKDQGAHQFYRTGRLSLDGEIQVGVFKKALQQVRIAEEERHLYEPWSTLSRTEILERAADNSLVGNPQVKVLRERGDIAVHIMDTLQALQATEYPDIARDVRTQEVTTRAFALVLSSIHGHPLK